MPQYLVRCWPKAGDQQIQREQPIAVKLSNGESLVGLFVRILYLYLLLQCLFECFKAPPPTMSNHKLKLVQFSRHLQSDVCRTQPV